MSKLVTFLFIAVLLLSGLVVVEAVSAQSVPTPSVPEFTVEFFDNSYDVPASYEIDSYTGENVTVEGYHVENKTIQLTIKNQPHSSSYDYYYNVRVKGHFSGIWHVLFSSDDSPEMSGSEFTVITFSSSGDDVFRNIDSVDFEAPSGGEVDFQVQAFVGYYESDYWGWSGGWVFETVESSWSTTQTLAIPENQTQTPSPEPTPTPSPTPYEEPQQLEQDVILGLAVTVAVLAACIGLLIYFIKRK
jgi:hypothetical protein